MTNPNEMTDEQRIELEFLKKETLRLYEYDEKLGTFKRKYSAGGAKSGTIAGKLDKHGYLSVLVDMKYRKCHRLAYLIVYNKMPLLIDHINGNRSDNRIENLREATVFQNAQNAKRQQKTTKVPFKGVDIGSHGKFRANINYRGKRKHLGYFEDPKAAAEMYDEAALEFHGEFASINFPEKRNEYFKRIKLRRDALNPSPKVQELVDAVERVTSDEKLLSLSSDGMNLAVNLILVKALANFRKEG